MPDDGSLNKGHFQKFLKRLRKHFPERKIRYYHCGEYGDNLQRPHYHACFFNLRFDDMYLVQQREGISLFSSETLEKIWGFGFVTIGELSFQTAAYTARYILKKVTGEAAKDHYISPDGVMLQPEYTTMSRGRRKGQGIGAGWLQKYQGDCYPSDEMPVPGTGVIKKLPRYYDQLFGELEPEVLEEVKHKREKYRRENAAEFSPERLEAKYKVKKAQVSYLKRSEV